MAHRIDTAPGRTVDIAGKSYLYFGGTAYLGLQTDKRFQKCYIQNVKKYGTHYGASRKSNVRLPVLEQVEQHLAQWAGSQACTTVSSGYLAAQLTVQSLLSNNHTLFHAPNAHPALQLPEQPSYDSYGQLTEVIRNHLHKDGNNTPVVLLDSIDFSRLGFPNFKELRSLPLEHIVLVIDDSHGIGILGENGSGIYPMAASWGAKEVIVCCSLGKALGIQGGAILGTTARIGQFTNTAFFAGSSPAAPSAMATVLETQGMVAKKRKVLKERIDQFISGLKNPERFLFNKHHPAFCFADSDLVEFLWEEGIVVTHFRYPNEDSSVFGRIILSAAHHKTDIETLLKILNNYPG